MDEIFFVICLLHIPAFAVGLTSVESIPFSVILFVSSPIKNELSKKYVKYEIFYYFLEITFGSLQLHH